MLSPTDPREAYRRSAFDARVQGSDAASLVELCLEQAIDCLALVLSVDKSRQSLLRSQSLARAITAITALEMGVDGTASLARPLLHFYRSAKRTVLSSIVHTDGRALLALKNDLLDLRAAFRTSSQSEADSTPVHQPTYLRAGAD